MGSGEEEEEGMQGASREWGGMGSGEEEEEGMQGAK